MSYRHMVTLHPDMLIASLMATALFGGALAGALWWVLYRTRACPGGRVDVVRPPVVASRHPGAASPQDQIPTAAPSTTQRPTEPGVPDFRRRAGGAVTTPRSGRAGPRG